MATLIQNIARVNKKFRPQKTIFLSAVKQLYNIGPQLSKNFSGPGRNPALLNRDYRHKRIDLE
jgi:hypothetical protein